MRRQRSALAKAGKQNQLHCAGDRKRPNITGCSELEQNGGRGGKSWENGCLVIPSGNNNMAMCFGKIGYDYLEYKIR